MTKLAFAGSGRITVVHGLAAQALGLPVTRVASQQPDHAAERATQLGATACGYGDLPGDAEIVLVATPPARHASDALAALEHGAAVIVEKPLATTLTEADALVTAAGPHGSRVGYAENLLYAPIIERAVELATHLGPLHHLEVRSLQSRPDWGSFLTAAWGGGVLFDLGVHPIAVALALASAAGPACVASVSAHLDSAPDIAVDEYAEVTLRFDTGLEAHVTASWRHSDMVWDLEAAAATGVVRAELVPAHDLEHNGDPVALPPPRAGAAVPQLEQFGYVRQLEALTADLTAGRRPRTDAELGRTVLDVVCAAYASAADGGAPVAVPFSGPRDATPLSLWLGPAG